MTRALSSVGLDYRATVASLVTVSRMVGMALGLAALSALGVEHFQGLSAGLQLPIPQLGEASEASQARTDVYFASLNEAGLSLFHNFFQIAGGVALVGVLSALLMRADRRELDESGV